MGLENSAELEAQLVESLNSATTIKRFGIEEYANLKTENSFIKLLQTVLQSSKMSTYVGTITNFVSSLFTIPR